MRNIVVITFLVALGAACMASIGCESAGKGAGYVTQEAKEVPGELEKGFEEGKKAAE